MQVRARVLAALAIVIMLGGMSAYAQTARVVDQAGIEAAIVEGGGSTSILVTLHERTDALSRTNFKDRASLATLHATNRAVEDSVIARLSPTDLNVTALYDNFAGFAGEVTAAGLAALQADPDVATIEPNLMVDADLSQGIPLMNATATRSTYNGAGMSIAIVDTGIDYTHPMLGGGGFPNSKVLGGYDFGDNDADPIPGGNSHGTACAGLAAGTLGVSGDYIGGVAHNAKLYALKITSGSSGSASFAAIASSWDWCVTNQNNDPANPIMIISTSFGGGELMATCDAAIPTVTAAATAAIAAGITLFCSSGNDGYCNAMGAPACISTVISVGAVYDSNFGIYNPCVSTNSCAPWIAGGCTSGAYVSESTAADKVTAYSNSASFLSILGPANQAYTTDITGASGYSANDYYNAFGGTSAATPYAAGAAACLQQAALALTGSYLSPADLKTLLINTGDNLTDSKNGIIKPRVNLGNAVSSITPPAPANDDCAYAIPVADNVPVLGTNVDATGTDITSCTFNDTLDVWYTYTPKVTGPVFMSTCSASTTYDTSLAVFDACGGTQVACDDDEPACVHSIRHSQVIPTLQACTTYLIRVSGYNGASGTFGLTVSGGLGGGSLFALTDSANGTWTIDRNTASPVQIGPSGVTNQTVGLAHSGGSVLYGSTPGNLTSIQIDGSGSAVVGAQTMEAMAYNYESGLIYAALNGAFKTVNPATGALVSALTSWVDDVEGLAFDPTSGPAGTIFGMDDDGELHAFNVATSAFSVIGNTGLGNATDNNGLAYAADEGVLYLVTKSAGNLYRVNKTTAAATLVGNTGVTGGTGFAGLTWGPVACDAPVSEVCSVAVLFAAQPAYGADVVSKLQADGRFASVTGINVNTSTPSVATLMGYSAVLVFSDTNFQDATALGNNLADYHDAGGGVVTAIFAHSFAPLSGRWDTGGYQTFVLPSANQTGQQTLGTVQQAYHPIMSGVGSFDGGSSSYRSSNTGVSAGSTRIADWTDGSPLVVTRNKTGHDTVGLGFFPPSSDTGRPDFWQSGTDGALLLANALEHAAWSVCVVPSPSPSPNPSPSPSPNPSPSASPNPSPSASPNPSPSASPNPSATPAPSATPTAAPCCPGDANNSGSFVDANDFIAVQANFGADNGIGGLGDANCSGSFVDANDFIAVQANFGSDCG